MGEPAAAAKALMYYSQPKIKDIQFHNVYRTPRKGWAVRSWDYIPSGAPVCEYIGKLMKKDDVDATDDVDAIPENSYILDIDCLQMMKELDGRERRLGGMSIPSSENDDDKDSVPEFCIDAGPTGNVARFINHSCQPNLYVQCVLSTHHDIKQARVVLFAAANIPPLKELTYDYGYALNSVVGPDGKIKQQLFTKEYWILYDNYVTYEYEDHEDQERYCFARNCMALPPAKRQKRKLGQFLLDVLNITYLGNDQLKPAKQLGTIKLVSGRGLQYLYNVEEVDTRKPSIKYGDAIPLTVKGPTPFFYDDFVYLDFDLFCGTFKGVQNLEWEPCSREVSRHRVLFQSMDGTGWILANIGRFSDASITNVKLNLINNSPVANVSGVVFAANSELDQSDCASVLFLKNHGDEIKVGPDGEIPLSKSFVGVPVDCQLSVRVDLIINGDPHTSVLKFDPIEERVVKELIPSKTEAKVQIQVTWGVEVHEAPIYEIDFIRQRKIKLWSADDKSFMVEEAVALEFHPLRDMIKLSSSKEPEYCVSGITGNILLEVINYFRSRVSRSFSTCYNVRYFGKHDLVTLFNLIQAAHHLQDKSLMDLTCRALAIKVEKKTHREIMKMSNIDNASIQILTRTYSEEGARVPSIDSILRKRGQKTFINERFLVDVPVSSLAKKYRFMFKDENPFFAQCLSNFLESMESQNTDLEKLLEATRQLHDLIDQDAGLVDYLSFGDVKHLLFILGKIDNSKDTSDINIDIQSLAVRILSHVLSNSRFSECSLPAAPVLVRLLYNSSTAISIAGAIALTRLAFASHECYGEILHTGALEIAQQIVLKNRKESDLIQWLAKFVAVMCSRGLPPAKVKVVLAISEDLLLKYSFHNRHMVSICYALHFLTDRRHARSAIETNEETWNKLIKMLVRRMCESIEPLYITHDCAVPIVSESIVIAGSALGVIGNIARWGPSDQIQTLATDNLLLTCLRRMLSFESKFIKEACQIISNIAARSQTWIQVMHSAKLKEPLCSLLENDMYESEIKIEAAWAIINGIYGDRCQKIDNYSEGFHVYSRSSPLRI